MKKVIVITPSFNLTNSIERSDKNGFDIVSQTGKAVQLLLDIGVEVEFGPLFSSMHFQNAGTIQERAREIHSAFSRKDIDLILCTQGGHNSNDLLSELDFEQIKHDWKPFFGISDITVLLNAIYAKTKKPTYHGYDFVWQIGLNAKEASRETLAEFIHNGSLSSKGIASSKITSIRSGYGEGVALGGCLSSYGLLFGTPYDPGLLEQDFIFFIEDIGIHYERIEAYLRTLKMQSYFHRCKGLVIGSIYFSSYLNHSEGEKQIFSAISDIFGNATFPILSTNDIGHIVENRIIPIGGKCVLNTLSREEKYIVFPEYVSNGK